MTAKAALCTHLLNGEVLNVMNCTTEIGLTNCAREISRMIEKPFGVTVSRTPMEAIGRYGRPVIWFNYRLNKTKMNQPGIKKMKEYAREQRGK